MAPEHTVTDVEGLIVDEQAHQLSIGHIDECLARLWRSVLGLSVGQRTQLVESVQVRAGEPVGLTLIEVGP